MDYIKYVNIKQGSKSTMRFSQGNTLPMVQKPFGFASFAPQTSSERGNWYYHPDDRSFEGVRLTHQPSPWIGEHSGIVMLPQREVPYRDHGARWTDFSDEILQPHYMRYYLKRPFCTFELTPTEYGCCGRLNFERDGDNYFSVMPVSGKCGYKFDAENNRLYCYTDCNHRVGGTSVIKGYFVFRFEEGVVDTANTLVEAAEGSKKGLSVEGENTAIHLALKKQNVSFTMAASYISYEQALVNLKNDTDCADFDALKQRNADLWNEYLSRIEITADEDKLRTFYSCMYRAFVYPHKAYEIDAEGEAVHYSPDNDTVIKGKRYTDNGFWDTYRTVYPFYSIIAKDECKEFIEGFVQDYIDGGWLPCWTAGDAKKCMPSTAIDAVIADLAVKGIISGVLLKTAFEGMEKHANNDSPLPVYGREGCSDYLKLGYVPCDKYKESVNLTLDAAYFDYCLAVVAGILGYDDKKEMYLARSKRYANIFDSKTGFMRGKDSNGSFREGFDPISWGRDYTEACAWQTSTAVQHDIEGLAQLHGGKDKLVEYLDALFAEPAHYRIGGYLITIHEMAEMTACDWGQCAISNQPSFHIPFMYAYLGEQAKADYWLEKICREGFSAENDGFPGDEDNGSMAIWYIFTQLGIYPICPGKAEYTITKPLADNIKILGKELDLSGKTSLISHDELMKGLS